MRVFISYRRPDGVAAQLLRYWILKECSEAKVFVDVYDLPAGRRFNERIMQEIEGVDVFVALIGADWTRPKEDGTHEIQSPSDWIHREFAYALNRRRWILPVYLPDVQLPDATSLPPEFANLLRDVHSIALQLKYLEAGLNEMVAALSDLSEKPNPATSWNALARLQSKEGLAEWRGLQGSDRVRRGASLKLLVSVDEACFALLLVFARQGGDWSELSVLGPRGPFTSDTDDQWVELPPSVGTRSFPIGYRLRERHEEAVRGWKLVLLLTKEFPRWLLEQFYVRTSDDGAVTSADAVQEVLQLIGARSQSLDDHDEWARGRTTTLTSGIYALSWDVDFVQ